MASELERTFTALSLARPEDLTFDGTLDGDLDPDKVDAFYAALLGVTVSELKAQDTDG